VITWEVLLKLDEGCLLLDCLDKKARSFDSLQGSKWISGEVRLKLDKGGLFFDCLANRIRSIDSLQGSNWVAGDVRLKLDKDHLLLDCMGETFIRQRSKVMVLNQKLREQWCEPKKLIHSSDWDQAKRSQRIHPKDTYRMLLSKLLVRTRRERDKGRKKKEGKEASCHDVHFAFLNLRQIRMNERSTPQREAVKKSSKIHGS
jgi:hypothetical protein